MSSDPHRLSGKLRRAWRLFDIYTDAILGVLGVFVGVMLIKGGMLQDKDYWWTAPPVLLVGGLFMLYRALRRGGWLGRRS